MCNCHDVTSVQDGDWQSFRRWWLVWFICQSVGYFAIKNDRLLSTSSHNHVCCRALLYWQCTLHHLIGHHPSVLPGQTELESHLLTKHNLLATGMLTILFACILGSCPNQILHWVCGKMFFQNNLYWQYRRQIIFCQWYALMFSLFNEPNVLRTGWKWWLMQPRNLADVYIVNFLQLN